jgi:hypothetical protein
MGAVVSYAFRSALLLEGFSIGQALTLFDKLTRFFWLHKFLT